MKLSTFKQRKKNVIPWELATKPRSFSSSERLGILSFLEPPIEDYFPDDISWDNEMQDFLCDLFYRDQIMFVFPPTSRILINAPKNFQGESEAGHYCDVLNKEHNTSRRHLLSDDSL